MRPLHNLAYYHYEKHGDYQKAYELYQRELGLRSYNRRELSSPMLTWQTTTTGRVNSVKAASTWLKALAAFPDFELVRYLQAFVFFKPGTGKGAGYPSALWLLNAGTLSITTTSWRKFC